MPNDVGNVETNGDDQDQLSKSRIWQPRRPEIQIHKKNVDPTKLQDITSSDTDEGEDIGIVFVGPGTITKTWDNTTFTRYVIMVGAWDHELTPCDQQAVSYCWSIMGITSKANW